jgi:hypothetical protein
MFTTAHRRAAPLAFAAALAAASAHAEITPQAQAAVDRYIEATGGRAAFEADTVLHTKWHMVSEGMTGTIERWVRSPDRILEVEQLGPLRTRAGYDGVQGWSTDLNSKKVSPLEGKDLEALRSQVWFLTEQWARDDQGGGTVTHGQHAYYKGRAMDALDVVPPVGPPGQLWFDSGTGLLARLTHRRDQYHWNEELLSWKTLAGRRRWTASLIGDSAVYAEGFERFNLDSVRPESPRDAAAFSPPASIQKPTAWLKAKGVARLPFRYKRGHVWIRASVNGGPVDDFILDTGCTVSALDRAWTRQAGIETQGSMITEGVGGVGTGAWAAVQTLRIAGPDGDGVQVADLKVGVLELNDDLETFEWSKAAGLVGYDVLGRFTVDIDFDRQVLVLHDPATFRYAGGGQALAMTMYSGIPTVEVTLNDACRGQFLVDVGNATVLSVNSDQVDRCHLFGAQRKEVQHWVGGIGGVFTEQVCRLDSVRVGPFGWSEPIAGLTTHRYGGAGSKEVQGNVGTSVLERFHCTFDYARGTLWLEPGRRYPDRDRFTRSGLWLTRWSGNVYVVRVVRKSPGEAAGFKVRDMVRAIDGRPIDRWTPEQIDALLVDGKPGTVVTLTVERELVNQDIEVTLADVL